MMLLTKTTTRALLMPANALATDCFLPKWTSTSPTPPTSLERRSAIRR